LAVDFHLAEGAKAYFPTVVQMILGKTVAQIAPSVTINELNIIVRKDRPTIPVNQLKFKQGSPPVFFRIDTNISGGQPMDMHFSAEDSTNASSALHLTKIEFHYNNYDRKCKIDIEGGGTYDLLEFKKLALNYEYDNPPPTLPVSPIRTTGATWKINGEMEAILLGNRGKVTLDFHYNSTSEHKQFKFAYKDATAGILETDDFKLEEVAVLVDLVKRAELEAV